jgi:hypothetical protein
VLFNDLQVPNDASLGRPLVIHVKEKAGSYLRLISCNPEEKIFIEKYVGWETWSSYRSELDRLKNEIDMELGKGRLDKAVKNISRLGVVLRTLLDQAGFASGFLSSDGGVSPLDVYYGKNTPLLPFEAVSPKIQATCFLPGNAGVEKPAGNFMLVYTETLEQTGKEMNGLRAVLKDRCELEIYSDRQFRGCREELQGCGYFHFAGHGAVKGGKGVLDWNAGGADPLFFARNLKFAFLNCCHAGSVAEGVLSDLFGRGVRHVIASPYGITDGFKTEEIAQFYRGFPTGDIGLSFRRTTLKYPDFGLFYRHFRSY